MINIILQDLIRNVSGGLGFYLRRIYYKSRLKSCGKELRIDVGVHLHGVSNISFGDNVWIDKNVIIIAGKTVDNKNKKYIKNSFFKGLEGEVRVGSYSHIGIGTIIQGHGGVYLGDCFTSSTGCKIYSLSNDPQRCKHGTISGRGEIFYIETPVSTGNNVWLGISVIVVGNHIGENSFIMPQSIVTRRIDPHSIANGNPAKKIRERF